MGEVIVITSGKGGVGKTTSTANIGTALAKSGRSVVVVDTDIGLRNLDVVLGLEYMVMYNLIDVIEGNCLMEQALIRDKNIPGLHLLPAAQTKDKSCIMPMQMLKLVQELKESYDYVLLDSPAGIERGFQNAIAGADMAIVVTTPEITAVRDADWILHLLEKNKITRRYLLVNRLRRDLIRRGEMMTAEDISEILGAELIGIVPEDESVLICNNRGISMLDYDCPAGIAYHDVAGRIMGEEIPFAGAQKKTGFWRRLFGHA